MLTNASVGVGAQGGISKFIAVNPKGNNCKLTNHDLQTPLSWSVAETLAIKYGLRVQVLFIAEDEKGADEVYHILKSNFENDFIPLNFCWRKQLIIALTRQNNTVKEIAEILKVSESAITQHRAVIYELLESEYGKPHITQSICWYADMAGLG